MRKTKEESEKTKRLLLDTALKVFSQKGYSATRLIDIAKEAGVTRGAIYWHFNNKAELYIELNKENRDRSMEIIDKVWAEDFSPVEKMRQVFIQFMIFLEEDKQFKDFQELALFKTEMIDELEKEICAERDDLHDHIKRIVDSIREGQENGMFRKDVIPEDMAIAFLSYVFGIMSLWIVEKQPFSMKEKAETFADIFIRGQLA